MRYDPFFPALSGAAGAYASPLPPWLNALLAYLDYIWFAALLGWTLVAMLWWARSRHTLRATWGWLPWTAATSLLTVAVVFFDLTAARLGSSPREAFRWGDLALLGLINLSTLGWWWQSAQHSHGMRRWLQRAMILPSLALFVAITLVPNHNRPYSVYYTNALVALALFATVPWWWRRPRNGWALAALTLAAIAPVFSTVGPVASYVLFMRERFSPFTPLSALSGVLHTLSACVVLVGLVRAELARREAAARRALWRETRPFILGTLASIGLGLLAAALLGTRQHRSANERALDQARLAVAQLDPETMARTFGPAFRLDWIQHGATAVFPPLKAGLARSLASPGDTAARRTMLTLARAARTARHVRIITFRDGWLVGALGFSAPDMASIAHLFGTTSTDPKARGRKMIGNLIMGRRLTDDDQRAWEEKREWLEGPLYTPVFTSTAMFARAPIVAPDGGMLGWLEFTYSTDAFFAETIQARVAPFIGSALGVVLAGAWFAQRRGAHQREAAQRAAAVAAESARVKTEFLAQVSHELRTPLQSILGYGRLLEPEIATAIGRVHLATQRQHSELMLRLVNDLLDLNAIDAGAFRFNLQPLAPGELVRQIVESLRPRAVEKNLALDCSVAADVPPWITADPERLRQIAINLIGNAIKFTERGRIEVALASTQRDAAIGLLELSVRDTGPGITPENRRKLFRPFSRLPAAATKEGSGLGLALVAALCRTAGGSVHVESDGRTGACFRVALPVTAAMAPAARASTPPANLHGRRILVADDNPLVRQLYAAYLTALGAQCEQAIDGNDALGHAQRERFDALVLDLAMPRMDGVEVARRWRSQENGGARIRIIGVSAHAAEHDRARALASGMDAFLSKPVELEELAAALSQHEVIAGAAGARMPLALRETHAQLAELFRAEAPKQFGAVADAIAQRDWPATKAAAHYLKSSAGVVREMGLYEACTELEDAAESGNARAIAAAWLSCQRAGARWLGES